MAIIKCPECGHQVSDKAPVCPSCGVEIASKITRCVQCGEIYFISQPFCPTCHHRTVTADLNHQNNDKREERTASTPPPVASSVQGKNAVNQEVATQSGATSKQQIKKSKVNITAIASSLLIAAAICGVAMYFYLDAKQSKEQEAYEYAMTSKDPLVLQSYLDNYKDAPPNHIRTIMSQLSTLRQIDADWSNAVTSNSKSAILDYLGLHPDSKHKAEALRKIDSLDWAFAASVNTLAAYNQYINEHPNGEYVDQANEALKTIKANTVSPEERERIGLSLRKFFQSINSKDENGLISSTAEFMSSFLGKLNATQADVIAFMNKIYKEDITSMNWRLNNDYKIDKKEIGDEEYEYSVSFSVVQEIDRTDPSKEKEALYKISAKINPDGKITEMSMVKVLE